MNLPKNRFLHKVFNRLAHEFKPDPNIVKQHDISPHLKFAKRFELESEHIKRYKSKCISETPKFIDIGGRIGELKDIADGFDYHILELEKNESNIPGITFIQSDICKCPDIEDESYDVVYSNNVFEHLERPWDAAKECIRIVKKNGLIIHNAPFAWRYHPCPVDYFRYTSQGLASLFCSTDQVDTLFSGYDLTHRRNDHRGGKMEMNLDVPPIDEFGGWREHWISIFIGMKH